MGTQDAKGMELTVDNKGVIPYIFIKQLRLNGVRTATKYRLDS